MLEKLAATPVLELHRRKPVTVTLDMPLKDVLIQLREYHRGAVLVLDAEGKLTGIFTERDVLLRLASGETPVGELMTRDPYCATAQTTIAAALELMREHAFRHLPIVDDQHRPLGIASIRDILKYVADHFAEHVLNLPPDPSLEMRGLYGG